MSFPRPGLYERVQGRYDVEREFVPDQNKDKGMTLCHDKRLVVLVRCGEPELLSTAVSKVGQS